MSESEAAVLNTERDRPDSIKSTELVKENKKWRKKTQKGDENSCSTINRLAIKIELKPTSDESDKIKIECSPPALQNGNTNSPESFRCSSCGVYFLTEPELELHIKSEHPIANPQPAKTVKTSKASWERMHYLCFACQGRPFLSKSSLHRHIAQHVTLPEVRLSRLKEVKPVVYSEPPEEPPSGRPQVALKRITVSCHERSPLKFLFKLTSDSASKDTFKVVKAITVTKEVDEIKTDVLDDKKESLKLISPETPPAAAAPPPEAQPTSSPKEDSQDSFKLILEDSHKEDQPKEKTEEQSGLEMVEASHDQCSVPLVEEPVPDSPKDTVSSRESIDKVGASEEIEKEIMRPLNNGEGDMDKIQSNSPSVVMSPSVTSQLLLEKNGLSSNNVDVPEEQEFIPLERLDQGTAAQMIENSNRDSVFNNIQQKEAETTILCEACGESVPGDQTALEDHCLCRGHYKCPICSVACASSDALAVHTEETHQNQDAIVKAPEKKKKSLRSIRRKHQELSKDSSIDTNNEISLPSPPSSENSNSMPPKSTKTSENASPTFNIRMADVGQQPAKSSDRRVSPPSQQSTASPPVLPHSVPSVRKPPLQNAPVPSRMPETIPPPPLTRPPNFRNMESQPRVNCPNVTVGEPIQPPPALYKMPTSTSHGMTNSQFSNPVVSTNMAYPRGIPASGYQGDPQSAAASNLAATLNSRYQPMHPGYPTPGQAPSYPPYATSMQMQRASMMQQQRFQMAPPPPYGTQMLHPQGPRVPGMSQEQYIANSQQAYNQSLLKAHLEQARLQGIPASASMLQSMQNLQQEHFQQQQQLQKQLFQQQNHQQMMQAQQTEQNQGQAAQAGQKRKSVASNTTGLIRYQHQNALTSQQNLQNQLQQNAGTPAKQRRVRENIGIPSKQTDSDCEIIAVQQRGEGVPVIQSIQGANASSTSPGGDGPLMSGQSSVISQPSSESSTIHLTDSITLSVRQPPGTSSTSAGGRSNNASAVASILATRGITVTPASGSMQQQRNPSGQQRSRPSPPPNRGPAVSPPQPVNTQQSSLNNSVSISHSSRQPVQHSNDGFAVPAPVGPAQRQAPRQNPPDRPPRPPTVDLTDENAIQAHAAAGTLPQCRLCDKQFPSVEALKNHMQVIHQTRNVFRCNICHTKHSSQHALTNHMKRVHKFSGNQNPSELVIPLLDLRNPNSVNRLHSLGVRHVISLSQLGLNSETGSFCIPIMSLDNNTHQRANTMGGLIAMGTTAVLPIGPVKSLANAQPPPQPVPQPAAAAAAPPPLAPIRPPHPNQQPSMQPNQYMQAAHQMPPR